MPDGVWLLPKGLLHGEAAQRAVAAGHAASLAGGPVAFSLVEVIEGRPGATRRRVTTLRDLATSKDRAIGERLGRVTGARAPMVGLPMNSGPLLMGVINVTPDSFSDGGAFLEPQAAVAHGFELARAGADILDIGGESTRPGSKGVSLDEELGRVLPVIEGLAGAGAALSLDTRKAKAMKAGADTGVHMLNDVSALTHDKAALKTAAASGLPVVLMHALGDPATMQDDPRYADVLLEIHDYLEARIAVCETAGIGRERLIADPGIGFGKTGAHNLTLIANVTLFHGLGVPLLLGASRKRFIGTLTGEAQARRRLGGSIGAMLAGAAQGVQIHRVHDVREAREALTLWEACAAGASDLV
ncbi:MAG: dihydropteroate synthase [Pseudomonadota bacterium]|nr:dihydropteroate synthase [Pseudomonadota bacterium]